MGSGWKLQQGWISCSLTGLRRPFRNVRGSWVVPSLRRPAWRLPAIFSTMFRCMAHPREGNRAGRQKPDVCRCAAFKKKHISSTTVSTNTMPKAASKQAAARHHQQESRKLQLQYTILLFRRFVYQLEVHKLESHSLSCRSEAEAIIIDKCLQPTEL